MTEPEFDTEGLFDEDLTTAPIGAAGQSSSGETSAAASAP
jgi:hypothetical protein